MEVYIDFLEIGDYEDFYAQLKEKLTLPEPYLLCAVSQMDTGT
jgi:ribonuclease inhibitor